MIEFKNIRKKYGEKTVIRDFNLQINKGELVVLIGASGSGKTTLLKMINRLIPISGGEILVDGVNIKDQDLIDLRRGIGYVIQQVGLFPHMTVKENIELIPRIAGKKSISEIEDATESLLEMVGLGDAAYLDAYPVELSGGQQQRVGVARAFATDADVILMDEPFSALDPITRAELQDELHRLQNDQKKTIVFVTHDMDEAVNLADRICVLQNGKVVQYDVPENIIKKPASDYVEEFVGKGRIWSQPEFITAKDLMIENPFIISQKRTALQAIQRMTERKVDSLPVVNRHEDLLGLVTLKQLKLAKNEMTLVNDIMKTDPTTVLETDTLVSILERFNTTDYGSFPVINEKRKLTGIITRSSLLSVLSMQFLEEDE